VIIDGVRSRAELEKDEGGRLCLAGTRSVEATRRRSVEEDGGEFRLAFQRDRDRILHARAFRRLKHKTQVFVPHLGDHPRTRLTHTLEVGQLARTIARALGLNEDLAEAIAMGHDLGHTAFGHTGETVLDNILHGKNPEIALSAEVVEKAGAFKHNYQSLRVVDLLEQRYALPGLNLTDQVREGILKHTSWKVGFEFPLPDPAGLFPDQPCHLEGQVVAVADEIAQQTHDLEDGLRAGSVGLDVVEDLVVANRVMDDIGPSYRDETRRWQRQNDLIRGVIRLFVNDVVAHGIWFSSETEKLFTELKAFIYRNIINQERVNIQDTRARKVLTALFNAFWSEPTILPHYVLRRAREELDLPYLPDLPIDRVAAEVTTSYHSSPGFARLIVDHLAGMSDRYALEEYRSKQTPSTTVD
jgi:dGTPase